LAGRFTLPFSSTAYIYEPLNDDIIFSFPDLRQNPLNQKKFHTIIPHFSPPVKLQFRVFCLKVKCFLRFGGNYWAFVKPNNNSEEKRLKRAIFEGA